MKMYIFGIHEQMGNVQTQSPRADQLWRDYNWRWRDPGIKPRGIQKFGGEQKFGGQEKGEDQARQVREEK